MSEVLKFFYTKPEVDSGDSDYSNVIIVEQAADTRFEFDESISFYPRSLVMRFLCEYGPDVAETDPSTVHVYSVDYLKSDQDDEQDYLKVIYEVEEIKYQVSAKFFYHPNPNPDYFTQVTDVELEELESFNFTT